MELFGGSNYLFEDWFIKFQCIWSLFNEAHYYYYYYYYYYYFIIIELTHRETILENTVEIEPQPVALEFNILAVPGKTVF